MPKLLLVSTRRWFTTAKLALAFSFAGCGIEVVCPKGHAIEKARDRFPIHRYWAFDPLRSILTAIERARPDLLVPCDDLATAHLHRAHERAVGCGTEAVAMRGLVEASLGNPLWFGTTETRCGLINVARSIGVRAPLTEAISGPSQLRDWWSRHGPSVVLKTDGTVSGGGVRIVHELDDAERGFRELRSVAKVASAAKQALVSGDMSKLVSWFKRKRAMVSAQQFILGGDANAAVACWKGKVLASVSVSVLETRVARGPASVVRILDNAEISAAVAMIAERLQLTGLYGFDFIVEPDSGRAHLIEMNPRATQTCHLPLGPGRDLTGVLCAAIGGEPVWTAGLEEGQIVALFPQELQRDPDSEVLRTAYHDVPWSELDMVLAVVKETVRLRRCGSSS